MKMIFTEDEKRTEELFSALGFLAENELAVGLPPDASARSRFILAVQEHGSPILRIPPRPVVEPALTDPAVQAAMANRMEKAAEAAARGSRSLAESEMAAAGRLGADAIRARIDAGVPPPNAPITVHGGWARNRISGKPVHIRGKGFDKPLYDTGELYYAFSWVIRRKK